MEEVKKLNNEKNKIVFRIKKLLLNYDLTIAYIQGEIDLRENEIAIIDSSVAASETKRETKKQKRRKIYLKADIEVYENFLADVLKRRNKLTSSIATIFERLNNNKLINCIFIDYYLKNNLTEEEIIKKYNLESPEELKEIVNTIDSLLISIYKF